MAQIVDSYSESNYSGSSLIVENTQHAAGQAFTGDGGTLNSAVFYVKKSGSPTGNVVAKIYNETHSTAFGTDSIPTGTALSTSDNVDISTISGASFNLQTFTFSGANKITLTAAAYYIVTIEYTGGDLSNAVLVGYDNTSPTHSGNNVQNTDSHPGWFAVASYDTCFYVYKDDVTTTSTSSSTSTSTSTSTTSTSTSTSTTSTSTSTTSTSTSTSTTSTSTSTTSTSTSTTSTSSSTSTTSTSTSTTSTSTSTTTTLPAPFYPTIFKIAKPNTDVLKTDNPKNLQFDSKYSTLKYFIKKTCNVTIDISNLDTTGSTTIQHNLGYYPYIEVYLINTENNYEYSPGLHTGASTSWKYTYRITKTTIQVYVETSGFSAPPNTITFYFTVFIFKNNLGL